MAHAGSDLAAVVCALTPPLKTLVPRPQLLSGGELPAADLEALCKKRKMLQLK